MAAFPVLTLVLPRWFLDTEVIGIHAADALHANV